MSARPEDLALREQTVTTDNLLDTFSGKRIQTLIPDKQSIYRRRSRAVITPEVLSSTSRIIDISLIMVSAYLTLSLLDTHISDIRLWLGFLFIFNSAIFLSKLLPQFLPEHPTINSGIFSSIALSMLLAAAATAVLVHFLPFTGKTLLFWLASTFLTSIPLLIIGRFVYGYLVGNAIRQEKISWNIALCGSNSSALNHLIKHSNNLGSWKKIVAIFSNSGENFYPQGNPITRPASHLEASIRTEGIDEVIVFLEDQDPEHREELLNTLSALPVKISLHYGIDNQWLVRHQTNGNGMHCLLELNNSPLHGWRCLTKRISDILISSTAIILTSPLMLLIAALIKLDSPGPILFIQSRYGFNNRIIQVLKFRSMHHSLATKTPFEQARKNDKRITKIGRFIRKTSLDELPQLFNVFLGDMSIVGPRPHAVPMDDRYKQLIKNFNARYAVVPGITGWAQINGARGETPDIESMERRFSLDRYYITHWSPWLDLKIMLLTTIRIWRDRNAY